MPALVAAVCGALAPLAWPSAPPACLLPIAALGAVAAVSSRTFRLAGCFLAGFAWTLHAVLGGLSDRLDPGLDGRELQVSGTVVGMPVKRGEATEFLFRPRADALPALPPRIRARWYVDAPDLRPGEAWHLNLRLRPPRSRVNFAGPDTERWYFSQGIGALATVRAAGSRRLAGSRGAIPDRIRHRLRDRIAHRLDGHPALGLVLSLAVADRSRLTAAGRADLARTGTGHLLAISGLHIGLAAMIGFWAGRAAGLLLPFACRMRHGLAVAWVCAMSVAGFYALLAGFGTSTTRALIMLLVLCITQLTRRNVHPANALGVALAMVLLVDPLAPLQAGFWLSFAAVAVLLLLFATRSVPRGRVGTLLRAQSGITLAMLPFGMYWFQQGTALGLPANLVAIPWVSLVVVPLVLAGAACLLLGWPAGSLLELAADAGQSLTAFLSWLAGRFPDLAWATPKPGLPGAALAVAGLLLLLLPRGMRIRWLAPFLCVPLLVPDSPDLDPGEVRVELLDVGQGLAALVDTRRHTLLYDSGPGKPGEWDLARTTIRPAMATRNTRVPKLIVISHGDMDHAGGLGGLRRLYPHVRILGNLGEGRIGCTRQLRWSWDGVGFRVLHPGPRLPYLGNASSCVLSVVAEQGAVLLPGDVDAAVEARLLRENIGEHELVVAPHHGSRTSSTPRWVERLRPRAVLFAAGPGNRFGFPDPGVVQRYLDAGALALSTADCGAIRVAMKRPGALELASARRARPAPWRWPPAPHCP